LQVAFVAHDFQADIDAIGRIAAVPTILDVVCSTTGMGFAAVARVTEGRWIACTVVDNLRFGLQPGGELKVETTICNEIREHREAVIINNVAEDKVWCAHQTPAMYGFQSYISMPITLSDGSFFGTLCAIDPKPRMLDTPAVVGMFKLFAELIAFHLDAFDRVARSEARLSDERGEATLREQFIAVLGHDLRNPLASIDAGAEMLLKRPLDDQSAVIVHMLRRSASRMAGLINDVLDFARGRLGGGLVVARNSDQALLPILHQVIGELRATDPQLVIEAEFLLTEGVDCDPSRVGQLFSNLLGNALTHGVAGTPVRARAVTLDGLFELSVSRCSVLECDGANSALTRQEEDALWQAFFTAAPARRREFEPSSKRRKRRPVSSPANTALTSKPS
jgi:K+-sensing histidine kinase KdpD